MTPPPDYDDEPPVTPNLSIGEAARHLLRARGMQSTLALAEVMRVWDSVVGEVVGKHAKPRALHGSTLDVEVDEPAWATEIRFQSGAILEGLAERIAAFPATHINVQVGRKSDRSTRQPRSR